MKHRRHHLAVVVSALSLSCAHQQNAPSLNDMLTAYDAGNFGAVLPNLRASAVPAARALAALTDNHPQQVLDQPVSDDPHLLGYRALAAWRLGDGDALHDAVKRLPSADPLRAELSAMAAVSLAAKNHRLRLSDRGSPVPHAFDPKMKVPIIEARVGDRVGRFFFDTGAEVTVVDQAFAKSVGVRTPEGATVTLSGNAGETTSQLGVLDRLELLGVAVSEVPVVIADLSSLPPKLGVVGIIGVQDLLSNEVIAIDYAQGQIERLPQSRDEGWPIYFVKGRAIVAAEGRLVGGSPALFRFDTGGRNSVLATTYLDTARAAGVALEVSEPESVEVKAIGRSERQRRRVASAQLCFAETGGCMTLTDLPVDTTPADSLIAYGGKLGADAFVGRVVELDYPAGKVRITRAE
jgi:hypothetical protein